MERESKTEQVEGRVVCKRCGGYFVADFEGDYACLMCGRPLRDRADVRTVARIQAGERWASV